MRIFMVRRLCFYLFRLGRFVVFLVLFRAELVSIVSFGKAGNNLFLFRVAPLCWRPVFFDVGWVPPIAVEFIRSQCFDIHVVITHLCSNYCYKSKNQLQTPQLKHKALSIETQLLKNVGSTELYGSAHPISI